MQSRRGRRKKESIPLSVIKPENMESSCVTFNVPKKTEPNLTPSNFVNFGGLNITVHRAETVDTGSILQSLKSQRPNPNNLKKFGPSDTNTQSDGEDYSVLCETPKRFRNNKRNEVFSTEQRYIAVGTKKIVYNGDLPENTNLLCWWCCHSFTNSPCYLPVSEDAMMERISVTGNFCSWNCVKAYNLSLKDSGISRRSCLIRKILKNLCKDSTKPEHITIAPPRQSLKCFGGIMDIEDFRNCNSIISLLDENPSGKTILFESTNITTR